MELLSLHIAGLPDIPMKAFMCRMFLTRRFIVQEAP